MRFDAHALVAHLTGHSAYVRLQTDRVEGGGVLGSGREKEVRVRGRARCFVNTLWAAFGVCTRLIEKKKLYPRLAHAHSELSEVCYCAVLLLWCLAKTRANMYMTKLPNSNIRELRTTRRVRVKYVSSSLQLFIKWCVSGVNLESTRMNRNRIYLSLHPYIYLILEYVTNVLLLLSLSETDATFVY